MLLAFFCGCCNFRHSPLYTWSVSSRSLFVPGQQNINLSVSQNKSASGCHRHHGRPPGGQATQQAPPWSLVEKSGVLYYISRWYPMIEVGLCNITSLSTVGETHTSHSQRCPVHSHSSVPRTKTVLPIEENFGLLYGVMHFVVVVLRPQFALKAFTPQFTTIRWTQGGGATIQLRTTKII
jgi:hypothetical protein